MDSGPYRCNIIISGRNTCGRFVDPMPSSRTRYWPPTRISNRFHSMAFEIYLPKYIRGYRQEATALVEFVRKAQIAKTSGALFRKTATCR